jgi:hypothetical protein
MAVSTFGVTLTVLREYMPGLPETLDSTTYPTTTQLTALITRKAAIWCARAENQAGVDITSAGLATTSQIYAMMQECIALAVCLQLSYGRERGVPTQVEQYKEQLDAAWARLIEEPGSLGDGQDVSNDAPYLFDSHVTGAETVRRIVRYQSLGVRLASSGRL